MFESLNVQLELMSRQPDVELDVLEGQEPGYQFQSHKSRCCCPTLLLAMILDVLPPDHVVEAIPVCTPISDVGADILDYDNDLRHDDVPPPLPPLGC